MQMTFLIWAAFCTFNPFVPNVEALMMHFLFALQTAEKKAAPHWRTVPDLDGHAATPISAIHESTTPAS